MYEYERHQSISGNEASSQRDTVVNLIRRRRFFLITANHLLVAPKITKTTMRAFTYAHTHTL